jgi:hypothetical protein
VLDGYSRLINLSFKRLDRSVDVNFFVLPDSETDRTYELEDRTWLDARNVRHTFRLTGLSRIAISTGQEALPVAIAAVRTPDWAFIQFMATILDNSPMFEWTCFPESTNSPDARWTYSLDSEPKDTRSFFHVYKERQNALWTIGLWFDDLLIDPNDPISVEQFVRRFPRRTGEMPAVAESI